MMKLVQIYFILLIISFFSAITFADVYRLDKTCNLRSTNTDFISQDNILGQATAGTEFEVISRKKLQSGATALEIKLLTLGSNSSLPENTNQSMYIYQNEGFEFKNLGSSSTTEATENCPDGNCYPTETSNQNVVKTAKTLLADIEKKSSEDSDIEPTKQSILEKIKNYSNSLQVQRTIKAAMNLIRRTSGTGKCYRKVKDTLVRGGLLKSKPSDAYARNAADMLENYGFTNLLKPPISMNYQPETAPTGSVLVYKSSVKCDKHSGRTMETGCGHTEIKLGDGSKTNGYKYSSDYKNQESILDGRSGYKYELIGVMVKL